MGPATKADLKNVSSAKKALLKKFSSRPWFRGAGIRTFKDRAQASPQRHPRHECNGGRDPEAVSRV